jgi:hypothetical protein
MTISHYINKSITIWTSNPNSGKEFLGEDPCGDRGMATALQDYFMALAYFPET